MNGNAQSLQVPYLPKQNTATVHTKALRLYTLFPITIFLEYRHKAYANGNKKAGYMATRAELTKLKRPKEYEWQNECGSQSLQMALKNLDSAYGKSRS